jgi:hypothetical protein
MADTKKPKRRGPNETARYTVKPCSYADERSGKCIPKPGREGRIEGRELYTGSCGPRGCPIKVVGSNKVTNQIFARVGQPFRYTTKSGPCGVDRQTCPVQMVFKEGQPTLRFCRTQPKRGQVSRANEWRPGKDGEMELKPRKRDKSEFSVPPEQPGFTIPVNSADEAQRVARAACLCWKNSPKGFFETVEKIKKDAKTGTYVTAREKTWRGSFDTCAGVKDAPLGRLR